MAGHLITHHPKEKNDPFILFLNYQANNKSGIGRLISALDCPANNSKLDRSTIKVDWSGALWIVRGQPKCSLSLLNLKLPFPTKRYHVAGWHKQDISYYKSSAIGNCFVSAGHRISFAIKRHMTAKTMESPSSHLGCMNLGTSGVSVTTDKLGWPKYHHKHFVK